MIVSDKIHARMHTIRTLAERLDHEPIQILVRFLSERIACPESYVVMLGETSSGKTTLINGFLGQELLKTSARPTTGTIVELMNNRDDTLQLEHETYHAINKDATIEHLVKDTFAELVIEPDDELSRLRIVVPAFPYSLQHMHLFDTPGYGSILEHHEVVLKEFIPNSDVIIYVISYRVGFKQNDHDFLQYIGELIHADTEVVLVVNRVPEGVHKDDARIQEIRNYAQDCLHRKLLIHIVSSSYTEGRPVLPHATELWTDLQHILQREERQEALQRAFLAYEDDILLEMKGYIEQQIALEQTSLAERQQVLQELHLLLDTETTAIQRIDEVFDKLDKQLEKMFNHSMQMIQTNIESELEDVNKWVSKDECVGFVQNHMLPHQVKLETNQIANWIQDELESLDEQLQSMLNTAVGEFERKIQLKSSTFQPLFENISNRLAHRAAGNGLNIFFKQFGGAGGAGAGVANAAKKGLKTVGKMFNKTFSRDTHNALASLLKKIGATSTKTIATAAAVIVEGIFYVVDSLSWQAILKKQIRKALQTWKEQTVAIVRKDLVELKQYNINNIRNYFDPYREIVPVQEYKRNINADQLQEILVEVDACLNQKIIIGVEKNE